MRIIEFYLKGNLPKEQHSNEGPKAERIDNEKFEKDAKEPLRKNFKEDKNMKQSQGNCEKMNLKRILLANEILNKKYKF